jgi:mRNA-degrading endonuclease HigB of HigAB toxin-antitoxin module
MRGDVVSKKEYKRVVEAKDRAMKELQARGSAVGKAELEKLKADHGKAVEAKEKEMEELKQKMSSVMSEVEGAIKKKAAEHERVRKELEEKTAEAGRWGAALQEVKSKTEQQEDEKLRWGAVLAQLKVETPEDLQRLVDDNNLTNEPRV